jgi:hypothetical protein
MTTIRYSLQPKCIDYYCDQNGLPLIAGTVQWSKATDHDTRKAVYETDVITPPATTPPAYANPHTLDSAGSMSAPYFANDEPYYIEVRASDSTLIKSFDNFPSSAGEGPPVVTEFDPTNYLLNPQFRFHYQEEYTNEDLNSTEYVLIAADNWNFKRNNINATNSLTFNEFVLGQTDVPENPKYYLRYACTAIGAGGETRKDIVHRIKGAETLSGETVTINIRARSSTNSQIQIVVRQGFGTGGTPSEPVETLTLEQLTTDWEEYTITLVIPSVSGKTLGTDNNDHLEIGIRLPLDIISEVDITNMQMNKGDELLEFNYKTYEMAEVEKKSIELPDLTDDLMHLPLWTDTDHSYAVAEHVVGTLLTSATPDTSIKGYLLCDGTVYKAADYIPGTDDKLTYRRLFNKIGNIYGSGADGFFCYTLAGSATDTCICRNAKTGAVTNWSDNDTGFSFSTYINGKDTPDMTTEWHASNTIRVTNTSNGNVTDATAGTAHVSIYIDQQGDASSPEKTNITVTSDAWSGGEYFTINSTSTSYYVWIRVNGVGSDPAPGGTGLRVDITTGYDPVTAKAQIAYAILEVLKSTQFTQITCNAASTLSGGESFNFNGRLENRYMWYEVGGNGTDPAPAGKLGSKIKVDGTETAAQVAAITVDMLNSIYFNVPNYDDLFLRAADFNGTVDSRTPNHAFGWGKAVGTTQADAYGAHRHNVRANDLGGNQGSPIGHYPGRDDSGKPWHTGSDGIMAWDMIDLSGESETRPKNIYAYYFIKY